MVPDSVRHWMQVAWNDLQPTEDKTEMNNANTMNSGYLRNLPAWECPETYPWVSPGRLEH